LKELTDVNHLHWEDEESPYIVGLFHDVCKADFYGVQMRNVKNDVTNQWERRPFYVVKEAFPIGHGEKSLYIISRYLQLTDEEAMCIRWHMSGYEPKESYTALSQAKQLFPNIVWTHLADELECAEARMFKIAV
jgi:HD superfamily phosphohydrolase YqeK